MKKLFLAALAGIGAAFSIQAADGDTFTYEGLIYNVLSEADKTCEVGLHDYKNADLAKGAVVIPPKVIYNGEEYTVTALGYKAFYGNGGMTSLSIPETVTLIKESSISQTMKLFELRLPNSVTEVEPRGIYGNWSLQTLRLSTGMRVINREACNANPALGAVVIPEGVETVCDDAFNYCSRATRIVFGSTVSSIGKMSFAGLQALPKVSIPANVKELGEQAFSYCPKLAEVTLEASTQPLAFNKEVFGEGKYAGQLNDDSWARIETLNLNRNWTCTSTEAAHQPFYNKTTLKTINLGSNVTQIPVNSFAGCDNIMAVNITGTMCPVIATSAFSDKVYSSATLTVPENMVLLYKSHSVWGRFQKIEGSNESGITDIEADENAPVEYFNLQGIRVATPENGLYIRRQGSKVTKVLVK